MEFCVVYRRFLYFYFSLTDKIIVVYCTDLIDPPPHKNMIFKERIYSENC